MAELSPVLSLVIGYWESSVVGYVYDRDHQGFQHCPLFAFIFDGSGLVVIFADITPDGKK